MTEFGLEHEDGHPRRDFTVIDCVLGATTTLA
jgi:hypothetical protein